MKWLVILALAIPSITPAYASTGQREPWRIVRRDYKEFCAGTTLTWDLRGGTLKTARGGCDPDSEAPPTITIRKMQPADLKLLRTLSQQALDKGISASPCNSVPMHILSGPLNFSVVKGSREIHSPNCINALGRRLEAAMAASVNQK